MPAENLRLELRQGRRRTNPFCINRPVSFSATVRFPFNVTNAVLTFSLMGSATILDFQSIGDTCMQTDTSVTCQRALLPAGTLFGVIGRLEGDAPGIVTAVFTFTGVGPQGPIELRQTITVEFVRCPVVRPEPPLLVCDGLSPCCICRRPFVARTS